MCSIRKTGFFSILKTLKIAYVFKYIFFILIFQEIEWFEHYGHNLGSVYIFSKLNQIFVMMFNYNFM